MIRFADGIIAFAFSAIAAFAGPPFQTDDPEPIEFRHYEFYTFATSDGTPVETDTFGPAVEFNRGAAPNVHLHIIIPAAAIFLPIIPTLPPPGPALPPSVWATSKPGSSSGSCKRLSIAP